MRRPAIVAAVVLLLAVTLVGGIWAGRTITRGFGLFAGEGEYTETGTTVVQSIQQLSSLTTVEYLEATTVEKGTDRGVLDFLRGDRVALLAVARVGAGIDLSQLDEDDVELDLEARSIRLTLPAPEIVYVAMDNEATQVYDRDTGLLTKGDPQLESQARRAAEDILRQDALDAGILDDARSSAVQGLRNFLRTLGFEDVRIVVDR